MYRPQTGACLGTSRGVKVAVSRKEVIGGTAKEGLRGQGKIGDHVGLVDC